jgi:phosphatidate phosphatase APP1
VLAAAAAACLLLTSCGALDDGDSSSEAFIGPLSNDLIVAADTECSSGRIGVGDTVRVSGFDYLPDSVVTLRWRIATTDETGTWDSVQADDDGEFTALLKVNRQMAKPGEILAVQAEGQGESGIMVLAADLEVGDC